LRLKRSEVARVAAGETLCDTTQFPTNRFSYRLHATEGADFAAEYADGTMTIRLPQGAATAWANGDEVSLYAEQDTGGSEPLALLVEKDFECLSPGHHRAGEDDEDTYPHPEAATGRGC